ncbi:carbonic anhydrase [Pseudomonas panipatensis]|nr:carbonic anhydrase [Pseudomonas panipatensis]
MPTCSAVWNSPARCPAGDGPHPLRGDKGAIEGAQLGHPGALLEKIEPAVAATRYDGERSAKNAAFVDAVAETNVRLTLERIRQDSPVLAGLEKDGRLKLLGALYHLASGALEFFG